MAFYETLPMTAIIIGFVVGLLMPLIYISDLNDLFDIINNYGDLLY